MPTRDPSIIVEQRGPVRWITMNRPERLNALTPPMAAALADELSDLCDDPSTRVVVLRGAGRAFCAGLDLKARAGGESGGGDLEKLLPRIVLDMRRCPQPVIALVHGPACGGGFAFALAADVRVAGESARMNDAFVTLGVSGCELGLSYFLPRHVGTSVAAELMYTGKFIDADRALRVGLVSRVVPDAELERAGEELAHEMLRVAPLALRKTKETLTRALDVNDLKTVIDMETATQLECIRGDDFGEAIRAFLEKRPPRWRSS